MSYLSVGIDHEHAGLDLLERCSVLEAEWGKVLSALLSNANINEAVFVSTCLRTEVYASIDRFHGAVDEITATLAQATGVPIDDLKDRLTIHFDRGVAGHLFAVASGLRSAVPGEHEVLGQLRRALERADEEHAVGPELAELFRRALAAGRRVRHETSIARGTTSFAHATVEMARGELGDRFEDAGAVVIGAGQLAAGIVRALRDARPAPARITVLNRTAERAGHLVEAMGDERVSAGGLEDIPAALHGASLLVSAIESPEPVVRRAHLGDRTAPLLVIDLGMPRVVDRDVEGASLVTRLDISHLRDVVERTLSERHDSIAAAEAIVDEEVERFQQEVRSRGAAAIVSDLRERLEQLRVGEMERRRSEFGALSAEEIERIESLTRSIVAKIAHAPTVALKEASGTDRGQRLTEATRTLFEL